MMKNAARLQTCPQTTKASASAVAVGGSRFGYLEREGGPGSPGASHLAEMVPGEQSFYSQVLSRTCAI